MNAQQMFIRRVRYVRRARGISARGLAALTGFPFASIHSYECGARNTYVEKAARIAEVLDVPLALMLNPDVPDSALLTPCGHCQGEPPAGYLCLTCGVRAEMEIAA